MMNTTTYIKMNPSPFIPAAMMGLDVPPDRDAEEYIDEYLDSILNENCRYNADWEFC